jgi:hypothetical protein
MAFQALVIIDPDDFFHETLLLQMVKNFSHHVPVGNGHPILVFQYGSAQFDLFHHTAHPATMMACPTTKGLVKCMHNPAPQLERGLGWPRRQNINHRDGLSRQFQVEIKALSLRAKKNIASCPLNVAAVLAVVAINGIQ